MDNATISNNPSYRTARKQPFKPIIIIAGVFILLLASIALTLFFRFSQGGGDWGDFVASVKTSPVKVQPLAIYYETIGSLEAHKKVDLNTETPGIIQQIYVKEGQHVKTGQALIRLKSDKQTAGVNMAQAELLQAQSNLQSAEAEVKASHHNLEAALSQKNLAESEYNRYRSLWEKDFVSTQDVDTRQTALEVAQAEYQRALQSKNSAEARLKQVKASVDAAHARYQDALYSSAETLIRAPFDGQIGFKRIDIGDYVAPTEKILTLVQANPLKVQFQVPEQYTSQLKPGLSVEARLDNYPNKIFQGSLVFIDPMIDEETRTILVKAEIQNHEGKLQPGQFVRARVIMGEKPKALLIPEESLIPQGERYFVYIVKEDKAQFRQVQVGQRTPGWVEITEGLKPSDSVITAGLQKVQDGATVKTLTDTSDNAGKDKN